eukprot:scaffold122328_cov19-Prasinocladus_malaysianus.AAC.1
MFVSAAPPRLTSSADYIGCRRGAAAHRGMVQAEPPVADWQIFTTFCGRPGLRCQVECHSSHTRHLNNFWRHQTSFGATILFCPEAD